MFTIQSPLFAASLSELRPTQITVGFAEVERKRKHWAQLKRSERRKRMCEELFPAVKGPCGGLYILDHHHAALALKQEGADRVQVGLVKDLSQLSDAAFWIFLDHFSWVHAYDARGRRRDFADVPQRLEDMRDDPFRSFASDVRGAGGFSKPAEPFQEFLWANFFRDAFPLRSIRTKRDKTLKKALELAKSAAAQHLPGWSGKA